MQFRLLTLLIVLSLGPPLLAGGWVISESITFQDNRQRANVIQGLPLGAFLTPSPRPANRQLGSVLESKNLGIEQP
jgi:hypothetical protein